MILTLAARMSLIVLRSRAEIRMHMPVFSRMSRIERAYKNKILQITSEAIPTNDNRSYMETATTNYTKETNSHELFFCVVVTWLLKPAGGRVTRLRSEK